MKRLVLLVLFFAGLAAANPFVVTYLSEFSTDTTGEQWLELHALPGQPGPYDLSGWQIITSTSVCVLSCTLYDSYDYVMIDSADLAQGINGTGAFRLNPDSDFIELTDANALVRQIVSYPRDSTSKNWSHTPPRGGSASFWNADFAWDQAFNWYTDSTPTPGEESNDYGTISGTVLLDSMPQYADVYVYPRGRDAGQCLSYECGNPSYCIQGLGAGPYKVEACVWSPHGWLRGFYPDSVCVGAGETLAGVNIDLRGQGVAEQPEPQAVVPPTLRTAGMQLVLLCPEPIDARLAVYDQTGACRAVLHEGLLEPGVHRFDLTSRVRAGVYFAQLLTGRNLTTRKVVVMH